MYFCKFKDILGLPGKKFHKHFGFGFAILDLVFALAVAMLITYFTKICLWKTFIMVILLAIILHRLFCVNTVLNVMIFGRV